ncbi:class I SAM-dependent methyltransferase [Nonomuraea sp. KC401]|uniref:class I SAM-dependent methyltransferase n=1 Tax=unclassified Nonomuraea TaxID=2593643 RepID=UPI0010FD6FE3|nr:MULTISPECIES: class I SAM-dependent methyltransferase [unclassified Nonomuraea]NBE94497.1 methyltransferase domain-containing protein [Nonomuraea sp. K271]TLF64046.1 class I SAM-dependent methyltransferase [Nonomuraea sp. KC401]
MPTPDLTPISSYWDATADAFDDEPDHGLHDPQVRAAWSGRLAEWLPAAPSDVLDLGCGTGSLALLLAGQGHRPTGVDLSPRMVEQAERKLTSAGFTVPLLVGDAGDPPVAAGASFDVILARHLVWTLPDPEAALRRWLGLLRPAGRLVLVEGRWQSAQASDPYTPGAPALRWPGGVTAQELTEALRAAGARVSRHERLTDPTLWGRAVEDERYVLITELIS